MKISLISIFILLTLFLSSCATLTIPIIIQFDSNCEWAPLVPGEIKLLIPGENKVIVGTDATDSQITSLTSNSCVLSIVEKGEATKDLQQELNSERDQKIRELQLDKTLKGKDVIDKDRLNDYLLDENNENSWPGGIISAYQLYVTPDSNAVISLANSLDGIQEIYSESLSWVWISDQDLNQEEEEWLYPEEFLTQTSSYNTNPTGEIASDCEEQANTLASTLIANGYNPQNVRMVLGLVDFDGTTGGHAWVQVYENGRWFDIEPTSGAYYSDGKYISEYASIPYDYFKYREYPSIEIWVYYNNLYYLDVETGKGNAPSSWSSTSGSWLEEDVKNFRKGKNIIQHQSQQAAIFKLDPNSQVYSK
jgi:hypothetical protein